MRYTLQCERRRLLVWDDGRLVAEFPVAVGRPDSPTLEGNWRIRSVGPRADDPDILAELNTPRMVCIRRTDDLDSLEHARSGG